MTTIINVLLSIVAAVLFFGIIEEYDACKQRNITIALIAVLLFIVAFNTIM